MFTLSEVSAYSNQKQRTDRPKCCKPVIYLHLQQNLCTYNKTPPLVLFLVQMKWNESGFRPPLCTYRRNWARRNLLRMVRWLRWHWPPDTWLEIRALAVWGRARYLLVTEAPHPTILTFTRGWVRNIFCFFQTAETGNRTPNSGVKGSGANQYPRAPAHFSFKTRAVHKR